MGTSSCIAVWEYKEKGIIRGKSVHWDGYPDYLGVALQNWVIKNGRDKTIEILINSKEAQSGWSSISKEGDTRVGWNNNCDNNSYFCRGEDKEKDFYTISRIGVTSYTYILKKNSIEVYFFDELLGKVKYFDIKKMKNL